MTLPNEERANILEEAGTLLKQAASNLYKAAIYAQDDRVDDSELLLDAAMLKQDEASKKIERL